MKETEMGNRGSKSGISLVKEQRVDGSCCTKIIKLQLRYTLIEKIYVLYLTIYLTKLEQKIQVKNLQIEKQTNKQMLKQNKK
jgi:hypothetical protein